MPLKRMVSMKKLSILCLDHPPTPQMFGRDFQLCFPDIEMTSMESQVPTGTSCSKRSGDFGAQGDTVPCRQDSLWFVVVDLLIFVLSRHPCFLYASIGNEN